MSCLSTREEHVSRPTSGSRNSHEMNSRAHRLLTTTSASYKSHCYHVGNSPAHDDSSSTHALTWHVISDILNPHLLCRKGSLDERNLSAIEQWLKIQVLNYNQTLITTPTKNLSCNYYAASITTNLARRFTSSKSPSVTSRIHMMRSFTKSAKNFKTDTADPIR